MFVLFWCFSRSCDITIDVPDNAILRVNETLLKGQELCINGKAHFYLVLNKFDYCAITAEYLSKVRDGYVIQSVEFDWQSYTQPFIDFGSYAGVVRVTALEDVAFQAHAIERDEPCLEQVYITTKQTNSVQFSSKWSGLSELKPQQRLCLFLCPFAEFENIKMLYQVDPASNYVSVVLSNETVVLPATGSDTEYTDLANPAYAVWESGEALETCFLRVSYTAAAGNIVGKGFDGFYPVFNETLTDTLSREAIIWISVGSAVIVILIAVLIVTLVITKKRRVLERNRKTDSSSSEENGVEMVEERKEVPYSPVIVTDPLAAPAIEYVRVNRPEKKQPEIVQYEQPQDTDKTTDGHEEEALSESDSFESVQVEVLDIPSAFNVQKRTPV